MTLCVIDGKECECKPQEGVWCRRIAVMRAEQKIADETLLQAAETICALRAESREWKKLATARLKEALEPAAELLRLLAEKDYDR